MQLIRALMGRFFYLPPVITSRSPHIRDTSSVHYVWNSFVIATLPAWILGMWNIGYQTLFSYEYLVSSEITGWRAECLQSLGMAMSADSLLSCLALGFLYFFPIFIIALSTAAFWESVFARIRKRTPGEGCLYFGWMFALVLPATVPLYQVALGLSFGLLIGSLIYGGSGRYLVNPVLLGLAFLVFSYPALIFGEATWVPIPGFDQPTVLELVSDEGGITVIEQVGYVWQDLFWGRQPGPMGVTSVFAVCLGAIYLLFMGIISWRVVAGSLIGLVGAVFLFNAIPGIENPLFDIPVYWHLLLGGFLFGTVFFATDPVAGADTSLGRWMSGVLVGVITVVVRVINPSYYEGVMLAILFASLFSPLFDAISVSLNIRRREKKLKQQQAKNTYSSEKIEGSR